MEVCVPDEYEPVPDQVAGHFFKNGGLGLLRRRNDQSVVLKPVQRFPKGEREMNFYKEVFSGEDSTSSTLASLQRWLPQFHGVVDISLSVGQEKWHHPFLMMENLSPHQAYSNIADVKIGRRCWDDEATAEKIASQLAKYPLQEKQGFRISAMRVYDKASGHCEQYGKQYGYSLDGDGVAEALAMFFSHGEDRRHRILTKLLQQLESLLQFFQSQDRVHFYSSSLLILFDGSQLDCLESLRVRMIDFAHSFFLSAEDRNPDENYIFGLVQFSAALQRLQ